MKPILQLCCAAFYPCRIITSHTSHTYLLAKSQRRSDERGLDRDREREQDHLIRLLSLRWCFEWLQVAIIGQDERISGLSRRRLSVRQVEMKEALSRWHLKFITVTFQFFWLGWFRYKAAAQRCASPILQNSAEQSHLAQINLCIYDRSSSLSLSLARCEGWNWLIVVFLLSDWYKCRLAAIAELQVRTKGNNSFNYNDRNQTQGTQGISQAKENIIRHWNIVLPRCSHASSERLP